MLRLDHELLHAVAQQIRPRHMMHLWCTSKHFRKSLDTDQYWSRPAVHAISRHFEEMEMKMYQKSVNYPYIHGLFDLSCLSCSYYEAINATIGRARTLCQISEIPEISDCAEASVVRLAYGCQFFMQLRLDHASEDELQDDHVNFMIGLYESTHLSCKELVKRETELDLFSPFGPETRTRRMMMRAHLHDLDDKCVYDRRTKVHMVRRFVGLLFAEDDIVYRESMGIEPCVPFGMGEAFFVMRIYRAMLHMGYAQAIGLEFAEYFVSMYNDVRGDMNYEYFNFEEFALMLRGTAYYQFDRVADDRDLSCAEQITNTSE